ncbi:response regulator [Marinospirillum sp. MEB164]|uniref:Response regulator n=1 Tax=Marinospirillum alkalitolerans TaxID=3123374 RepID=A0ABW8PY52_9GAMM
MHILVVDDDALAAEMLVAILEDQEHQVVQASDALAALEALQQQPSIELIISDLQMPLMNGIELFRELRDQGSTRPFILLSGDDPEALKAQEPALSACLIKDFALETSLPQILARLG